MKAEHSLCSRIKTITQAAQQLYECKSVRKFDIVFHLRERKAFYAK